MNHKQVPLGVTDPGDEAGAWAALRAMLGETVREAVGESRSKVRPGTLPELVELYLAERAGEVAARTVRGYRQHLSWLAKKFPRATAAGLPIPELLKAANAVATWGDTHRANVLATVGALLKWAGRAEKIPLPPKASRGADSVIPEPVYRRCLTETRGDFRQLLRFLWLTGCRPGEATGLTAALVRWDSATVILREHKTRKKTGKTRLIYLAGEALQVLEEQRERHGDGLLFRGNKGRRLSLQAMTMRFERLSLAVGHHVTSYMFRHSWATRALKAGVPAAHVAAMLGQADTKMVFRHYSHLTSEAELLRQTADRVAGVQPPKAG